MCVVVVVVLVVIACVCRMECVRAPIKHAAIRGDYGCARITRFARLMSFVLYNMSNLCLTVAVHMEVELLLALA